MRKKSSIYSGEKCTQTAAWPGYLLQRSVGGAGRGRLLSRTGCTFCCLLLPQPTRCWSIFPRSSYLPGGFWENQTLLLPPLAASSTHSWHWLSILGRQGHPLWTVRIWTGRGLSVSPEEDADFGAKAEKDCALFSTWVGVLTPPLFQPMGSTSGYLGARRKVGAFSPRTCFLGLHLQQFQPQVLLISLSFESPGPVDFPGTASILCPGVANSSHLYYSWNASEILLFSGLAQAPGGSSAHSFGWSPAHTVGEAPPTPPGEEAPPIPRKASHPRLGRDPLSHLKWVICFSRRLTGSGTKTQSLWKETREALWCSDQRWGGASPRLPGSPPAPRTDAADRAQSGDIQVSCFTC